LIDPAAAGDFLGAATQKVVKSRETEKSMTRVLMGTLIAFVITTVGAAAAKEVSIKGHRPSQVKAACNGIFMPPSDANGSYGCLNKNGSGIYCGGDTAQQKQNLQYVSCSKSCHPSDVEQGQREYAMSFDTDRVYVRHCTQRSTTL
jgi:hypothetical protein